MSKITNEFDKNVFSSNLKRIMNEKNWKNKDLASFLGLSKSAISNYIAGRSVPRTEVLLKIAEAFDVPIETLIKEPLEGAPGNSTLCEGEHAIFKAPVFAERLNSAEFIYRSDHFNGEITFPYPIYDDFDCYALRITDNLLASSGIANKSTVIFTPKKEVKNGELAAVLLKKELKIVVRRILIENNKITLSTDKTSEVFKFKSKSDEVVLLGQVVVSISFLNS